ncbi:hypothetical protein [Streptomyces sp. PSAA01]|nr:hypothetical protein [Streptomyces sp. PSAA01]
MRRAALFAFRTARLGLPLSAIPTIPALPALAVHHCIAGDPAP